MERKIKFSASQNPARNFAILVKDLEKKAEELNVSVVEVLEMFRMDLTNYSNDDYKKKIEEVEIKDVNSNLIKVLDSYLSRSIKRYKKTENEKKRHITRKTRTDKLDKQWVQIEETIDELISSKKDKTETEIIKGLITDINEEKIGNQFESKEKRYIMRRLNEKLEDSSKKEVDRGKAIEAMEYIEEIVEREHAQGKVKNKAEQFKLIRDAISKKDKNNNLGVSLEEDAQEYLEQMLDERVIMEEKSLYIDQVYDFTDGFKFLTESSDIVRALDGSKPKKFTDKKSYERFCNLRELLQKEFGDEYIAIKKLLEKDDIDDADRTILKTRKMIIDREREKKQPQER